ncbi:MAG TPA: phosphoenolpyruvate--protein phosphotransferase [Povalibacter sp.]|nr:phosphoenolpyruvate--protein phosphotransferase [Povalibacter sp.]
MPNTILLAPLSGWSAPLDEAPDAVFAQRMLGDGVAIDPVSNELVAPCDGEVISIAPSKHAIAVRAASGAEVLMHIGIDTVNLGGEGFELHVQQGAKVRAGQRLLSFDLDLLARRAKSLITPVVVTNGDQFVVATSQRNREIRAGETLLELQQVGQSVATTASTAGSEASEKVVVEHEHGIHARPAALIASYAKTSPVELSIQAHGRSANPRSAVALMSLGIRCGDAVTVVGAGPEAAAAVAEIKRIILSIADAAPQDASTRLASVAASRDSRETSSSSTPRATSSHEVAASTRETPGTSQQATQSPAKSPSGAQQRIRAVVASRGFAVGKAFYLRAAEVAVSEAGRGVAHESAELERGRAEVRDRLQQLAKNAERTAQEVIAAHLEFVDDWELVAAARRSIARGKSAAYAWRRAVRDSADTLRALGDPRIAERVDDLLDLEHQVLVALLGQTPAAKVDVPDHAIILAEDLKPSQLVTLDAEKIAGLCLAAGGPTSHVAILAAAMGVPALVAAGPAVLDIADDTWLILDAEQGVLKVAPEQSELTAAERTLAARRQRIATERSAAQSDCHTADGTRIEVFANLGSLADAQAAVTQGAEGCGLLRTEFLFLDREAAPDEQEQAARYQEIAHALAGRPLVIRTLDIGGDKPIAYLPLPAEQNPALGLRGVRTSLWRPELLRVQLRALLQVRPAGQCRILLPMITDLEEVRTVRRMIEEERRDLGISAPIQVGAMIETPASVVLADQIAREVEFLSIGTNDLTQYALAMDRGHADLAARIDALHPAVLRLISMTAQAASRQQRQVAVCGGLASDPAAVAILIGLGVSELSVVPTMIPQLKHLIRTLTVDDCRRLATQALEQQSAEAVREQVLRFKPRDIKVAL